MGVAMGVMPQQRVNWRATAGSMVRAITGVRPRNQERASAVLPVLVTTTIKSALNCPAAWTAPNVTASVTARARERSSPAGSTGRLGGSTRSASRAMRLIIRTVSRG